MAFSDHQVPAEPAERVQRSGWRQADEGLLPVPWPRGGALEGEPSAYPPRGLPSTPQLLPWSVGQRVGPVPAAPSRLHLPARVPLLPVPTAQTLPARLLGSHLPVIPRRSSPLQAHAPACCSAEAPSCLFHPGGSPVCLLVAGEQLPRRFLSLGWFPVRQLLLIPWAVVAVRGDSVLLPTWPGQLAPVAVACEQADCENGSHVSPMTRQSPGPHASPQTSSPLVPPWPLLFLPPSTHGDCGPCRRWLALCS